MKQFVTGLVLAAGLLSAADGSVSIPLRGREQTLVRLEPAKSEAGATVIFLPGDGGWRGAAVSMSKTIASWGYEVFGFDTKKYLEMFSQEGAKLSPDQLAADMRWLAQQVRSLSRKPVILAGWSQGAGMAVAAAAGGEGQNSIRGVITLGLPESAVLGWDWKASLAVVARREPDQPKFLVRPLLGSVAPRPLWMIYGSEDEYTSQPAQRALFETAAEPKRLQEIAGANHRFDGHRDELYRSMKEGLEWIAAK